MAPTTPIRMTGKAGVEIEDRGAVGAKGGVGDGVKVVTGVEMVVGVEGAVRMRTRKRSG